MALLQFAIYSRGGHVVTGLAGDVDLVSSQELRLFMREVFRQTDCVIADLAQVPFMDSYGLDVLMELHAWACACGGQLRLAAPQPVVCRLLAFGGFYQEMPPFPTVEAAAAAASAAIVDPTP